MKNEQPMSSNEQPAQEGSNKPPASKSKPKISGIVGTLLHTLSSKQPKGIKNESEHGTEPNEEQTKSNQPTAHDTTDKRDAENWIFEQRAKKASVKAKTCTIYTLFLALLAVVFFILMLTNMIGCAEHIPPEELESTICNTAGCKLIVSQMQTSIDAEVEPCDDFYGHVCGGWIRDTKIPPDLFKLDVYEQTRRAFEDNVLDILNHSVIAYRNQNIFQKTAALYQGCINKDIRASKGTKELEELLQRYFSKRWPFQANVQTNSLMEILAHIHRELGLQVIFSVNVLPDYHDTRQFALYISQGTLGVERRVLRARYRSPYYRILHRYKLLIYRCALIMGATVAAADLINDIVTFEAKLSMIMEGENLFSNPKKSLNAVTVRSLEASTPGLQWIFMLNTMMRDAQVVLEESDKVIVTHVNYLKRLSELLKKEPPHIVANYLGWRIIQHMGMFSIERFRLATFRFNRYRYGVQKPRLLSRECFRAVSRVLHFAIGRLYFDRERQKPMDRQEKVAIIGDELKDAFAVWLDLTPWLDVAVRSKALFKLREMTLNAGHPRWIHSDNDLNRYYSTLPDMRKEDFFWSMQKALETNTYNEFSQLKEKRSLSSGWIPYNPSHSDVYYYLGNHILISPIYLQKPFFGMTVSPPINFGGLGTIIARGMIMAMTKRGSMFDHRGALSDWFTHTMQHAYDRESRCFVAQLAQFTDPFTGDPDVDVIHTQLCIRYTGVNTYINSTIYCNDDLVSDNAAVKVAYKAYKVFMTKYEEFYKIVVLPGMEEYNQDQIFFISYAMANCEKIRQHSFYYYLNPIGYTPPSLKINLPLMNYDRFALAFNCPSGSNMNPTFKCGVY